MDNGYQQHAFMRSVTDFIDRVVRPAARRLSGKNTPLGRWARRTWVTWKLPRARLTMEALRRSFTRPTYVFVAPDAGLASHFSKVCIVAKTLHDCGYPVLILGCFKALSRCTVMDGRPSRTETLDQRRSMCWNCATVSLSYTEQYGLPVIDIGLFLDESEDIRGRLERCSELFDFQFDGMPFGKISAGDLSRIFKVSEFRRLEPTMAAVMADYIETCVQSYVGMKGLMSIVPVAGVIYFGDYGTLVGAAIAARNAGLLATNLSIPPLHNMDHRRLQVMTHHIETYRRRCIQVWPRWAQLAISPALVKELTQDIVYRLTTTGRTIYSPPIPRDQEALCREVNIDPSRKLLIAYTSSEDELVAVEQYMDAIGTPMERGAQPFCDQMDWLESLCRFVAEWDDLQLIIRVHPREAFSPQTGGPTEHLRRLKHRFSDLPANVRMVWPDAQTSSYGLGEMADVVLTSWSTIGTEMARLGVPVIAAFDHVERIPYGTVVDWVPTREEYFELIGRRLEDDGIDFDRVIQTNRWFNLYWLGYCIDISDVVPHAAFAGLPSFTMPAQHRVLERAIIGREDPIAINQAALEAAQSPAQLQAEEEASRAGMRRLVRFLLTGNGEDKDYRLYYERVTRQELARDQSLPEGYDALVLSDGCMAAWITDKIRQVRRSPMASRLAAMATGQAKRSMPIHRSSRTIAE